MAPIRAPQRGGRRSAGGPDRRDGRRGADPIRPGPSRCWCRSARAARPISWRGFFPNVCSRVSASRSRSRTAAARPARSRRRRSRARPPTAATVMFTTAAPITIAPLMNDKVTYDPRKDIVPIAVVAVQPVWLVVNAASPLKSAADIVQKAKETARQAHLRHFGRRHRTASRGRGAVALGGIQMVHVPFRGGGEVISGGAGAVSSILRRSAQPRLPVRCGRARSARCGVVAATHARTSLTCRPSPRSVTPTPPCCRGGV